MSDYQKMVKGEAKSFLDEQNPAFESDSEEFGGKSDSPNFAKWLDRTKRLSDRVEGVSKEWSRAEIEMIKASSRNAVQYGDPREAAFTAFIQDVLHELKKLRKKR